LKGWQLSGTLFARSGLPYTVVDGGASGILSSFGYGSAAYANFSGSSAPACNSPSSVASGPCLSASVFPDIAAGQAINPATGSAYGTGQAQLGYLTSGATGTGPGYAGGMNQRRNQFFGPHYFDTDMTIMKYTAIPRWEGVKVGVGAQFFNLFNHPNFESPVNDINNGNFGHVLDTVNTPTSILGSFLGGDASPRLIQLTMKINF
jgi:hypothetical protein